MHGEITAQVFTPAPKSEGKIGSSQLNERWQADLIDYKSKTPEKNDGNRLALVVIDIFSRFPWAETLQTKEPEAVAAAFQRIQRAVRGRVDGKQKAGAFPVKLSTDSGAEFKGVCSGDAGGSRAWPSGSRSKPTHWEWSTQPFALFAK